MIKNTNLENAFGVLGINNIYKNLVPNLNDVIEAYAYKEMSLVPSYLNKLTKSLVTLNNSELAALKAVSTSIKLEDKLLDNYKNIFKSIEDSTAAIAAFNNPKLSKAQELAASLSIQNQFDENYQKTFADLASISSINHLSKAFKSLSFLNNDILKSQGTIQTLLKEVDFTEIEVADLDNYASPNSEIQTELAQIKNFKLLSPQAKKYIAVLFVYFIFPYLATLLGNLSSLHIEKNFTKASEILETTTNKSELNCFLKGGYSDVDVQALKDYRVISGDKVNLREEPTIKSMVMLELPIFTLVKVLDKSHRSWLEVEVQIKGEVLQGWVARRYTEYFR